LVLIFPFQAIYLLYAKLEENHGLARRALKIYERAIEGVLPDQLYELFNIFLKQAASMKGVTATREIFEKAIDVLKDDQARLFLGFKQFFTLSFLKKTFLQGNVHTVR
jgi:hypothetical protein